jgi:hypothetical protein
MRRSTMTKIYRIPAEGYGMSCSEYGEALWNVIEKLDVKAEYVAKLEITDDDDDDRAINPMVDLILTQIPEVNDPYDNQNIPEGK